MTCFSTVHGHYADEAPNHVRAKLWC